MTAKTATKDKKAAPAKGALATADLPLKGGKDGTTKALDNSRDIKTPIPIEVINKAKLFAQAKDRMDTYKQQATDLGGELLDMMLKHALPSDVRIRIDTDSGARFIGYKDTEVTLVVEKATTKDIAEKK